MTAASFMAYIRSCQPAPSMTLLDLWISVAAALAEKRVWKGDGTGACEQHGQWHHHSKRESADRGAKSEVGSTEVLLFFVFPL